MRGGVCSLQQVGRQGLIARRNCISSDRLLVLLALQYPPALPQADTLPKPPNTTSTAQALQLVRMKTDPVRGQQPKPDLGQAEDGPSARSRKGKEKVDIDEEEGDVDEIAGVLPTNGSGHLEQRLTIKSSDVHWLMNSLPEVAPLYHGRFLPRGEGVRTR